MKKHKFGNKSLDLTFSKRLFVWVLFVPLLISGFQVYSNPSFSAERMKIDVSNKSSEEVSDATRESDSATQQQPAQRRITGVVVDESGEPLPGAAIVLLDASRSNGTITDIDGNFTLTGVPDSAVKIEVSYMGYNKMTIDVSVSKNVYNIVMKEDTQLLGEVVVVGFGIQKKETVTGAVSSIRTKDLVQSPQANVSNMLVGRMPGLLAVQRGGEPGNDASTLRIRGVATFASGEGSQDPLVMVDGIETDNFNNIDPNEIENLTILKDASATAVYGVRGANGVILITTRRGATGIPQISYSGNVAINQFTEVRETMGAYDYATLFNYARKADAYITGSYTPRFTDEAIEMYRTGADPLFYPDVDWYDLMLKDYSITTQHNVNISGGVDKLKYFVSIGYYNQQGLFDQTKLIPGYNMQSGYERYNFRSNLDYDINKRLSIRLNIASQMQTRTGNNIGSGTSSLMNSIAIANPMLTPGVVDGKIISRNGEDNPLVFFYQGGFKEQYQNNLTASLGLNYEIPGIKGLKFTTTVSYENFYSHQQRYMKANDVLERYDIMRLEDESVIFRPLFDVGTFQFAETYGKRRRTYIEAGFNYSRKFGDDHNVTALALYNQSSRVDPNLLYKIPNNYQGVVGRVTYDYKNRYLAEFNVGYNGTENFAEGKRFGLFPAYSLGWVASEESFFPKNNIVTFLKIRGSYGEVGNDRIGGDRFLYLPTTYLTVNPAGPGMTTNNIGVYHFGEIGNGSYNSYAISREGIIGNPVVTWERAKKSNIGAEIFFWKDKIKLAADFFSEKRDNILTNVNTAPKVFGADMPAYNLGKMKNSGWEADITYRDAISDFSYWVRGNYTYAHNEIQYMDEVPRNFSYQNRTGQILGQNFGLICDGIYNTWEEVNAPNRPKSNWNNDKIQPGDLIYRDINGDGIINDDDQVPIGYSNFPEIVYGFSFGGEWKGLDFSVLFQGAGNVSIYYSRMYQRGFEEDFSAPEALKTSWTQERYEQGLAINYPRLSEGIVVNRHNYQKSTFWVRDASYLRLKNVEIGYTLNKKLSEALHISSLRLFVNGSNLYTWSDVLPGVDPEAADGATNLEAYPVTRTYNIGLNIKF